MNFTKRRKRVIVVLALLVILSPFFYIYIIWAGGCCSNGDIKRSLSSSISEAKEKGSAIAIMKSSNAEFPKLLIERHQIKEPYKYPFISYIYLSDYYILDLSGYDSLLFVSRSNEKVDTLKSGFWCSIHQVPSEISVFSKSGQQLAIYVPDTIFTENIKNKPNVSCWQMLTWGPTKQKCLSECD